jgi:hypothetical protein
MSHRLPRQRTKCGRCHIPVLRTPSTGTTGSTVLRICYLYPTSSPQHAICASFEKMFETYPIPSTVLDNKMHEGKRISGTFLFGKVVLQLRTLSYIQTLEERTTWRLIMETFVYR